MKKIKISIDSPIVNDTSTLTHTSTSWQVSKVPDFSDASMLVVDIVDSTTALLEYVFTYDLKPTEPLYYRVKYKFNNGGTSGWSYITPINVEQQGIKMSGTVVRTPIVTLKEELDNFNDVFRATIQPMGLYSGAGEHASTSWRVSDTDSGIIYERKKDDGNLTSIDLDKDMFESDKLYTIEAKYHTNTNSDSNWGKMFLSTYVSNHMLYDVNTFFPLVPYRPFYAELIIYTAQFDSADVRIIDSSNIVVSSVVNLTTRVLEVPVGDLNLYSNYRVQVRIKLTDGSYTAWRDIYDDLAKPNTLNIYKDDLTYLNKQSYLQYMMTNGATAQSVDELYTNNVLLSKAGTNKIYRYRFADDSLTEIAPVIDLPDPDDEFVIPYVSVKPLLNGKVLLDYATDTTNGVYRKPEFRLYDYNPITNEFSLVNSVVRSNERYSTGGSNSLAIVSNNYGYYIPARELDTNGALIPLKLKKIDLRTLAITDEAVLPVDIYQFGSLIGIDENRLMFLGGSSSTVQVQTVGTYKRTNHDIYIYDIASKTWSMIATLPGTYDDDIYNFQPTIRKDRTLVIFNAVYDGPALGNQNTLTMDLTTHVFSVHTDDMTDNLGYRTLIKLINGDILRLTARTQDPQKLYKYISNTMSIDDVVDNTTVDVITDLVVRPGEVVTIESPYRYTSITIEGTSLADTGRLIWIDGDNRREFIYTDRIITRDTSETINLYDVSSRYTTITVLDTYTYTVHYIIDIPINNSLTLESPVNDVETIDIADLSTLTITG